MDNETKICFINGLMDMIDSKRLDGFAVSMGGYKALIKVSKPSVFALMSAGWKNGATVNGIAP